MNEHKIDALQIILNNELIMGALRDVFNDIIAKELPDATIEDDVVIGQKYRAYRTASKTVDKAFKELESYRKPTTQNRDSVQHI